MGTTSGQSNQQSGMFGNNQGFAPTINPMQFGNATYDFSGLKKGAGMLGQNQINIGKYNPYQFSKSQFGDIGSYGTTNPNTVQDVYNQALKTGVRPVMAQSKERMRQLDQGFGGGSVTSGAQKQLALRNAQQTGADVQNIASGIGSQIANTRLGEEQTARANDYATRNKIFDANRQQQQDQASENYRSAGFNADASNKMAQDTVQRASMMLQYGAQLPQLQMALNQAGMGPWNDSLKYLMQGSFNTIMPGENIQTGGGKK